MSNVALITGAGSGFGLGLTKELMAQGWVVYAADKNESAANATKELGAVPLLMDVTSDSDVNAGVEKIIQEQGKIDLLVANAGYGNFSSIEETTSEQVHQIFDVNFFGVERSIRAVLPHMRQQRAGRILITTSVVAHVSLIGLGWYAATKHALKAVAKALRQEVTGLGIKVCTIEPGTSKTGFGSVAFGLMEDGRSVSEYDGVMRGVDKWLGGIYRISPGPNKVVATMVRAATSKHPRPHYPASWDVRALKLVFYLLPKGLLDRFILWLARH